MARQCRLLRRTAVVASLLATASVAVPVTADAKLLARNADNPRFQGSAVVWLVGGNNSPRAVASWRNGKVRVVHPFGTPTQPGGSSFALFDASADLMAWQWLDLPVYDSYDPQPPLSVEFGGLRHGAHAQTIFGCDRRIQPCACPDVSDIVPRTGVAVDGSRVMVAPHRCGKRIALYSLHAGQPELIRLFGASSTGIFDLAGRYAMWADFRRSTTSVVLYDWVSRRRIYKHRLPSGVAPYDVQVSLQRDGKLALAYEGSFTRDDRLGWISTDGRFHRVRAPLTAYQPIAMARNRIAFSGRVTRKGTRGLPAARATVLVSNLRGRWKIEASYAGQAEESQATVGAFDGRCVVWHSQRGIELTRARTGVGRGHACLGK